MKYIHIAVLFFLCCMPLNEVSGQGIDINLLDQLSRQLGDQDNNDSIDTQDEENNEQQQRNPENLKEQLPEENRFGYQGERNFQVTPRPKEFKDSLEYFGYDFFTNNQATYSEGNIPVPADYVIGPGDNIRLLLYGNDNKKYSLQVNREGSISIPQIGPIPVAGLTFEIMRENIQWFRPNNCL